MQENPSALPTRTPLTTLTTLTTAARWLMAMPALLLGLGLAAPAVAAEPDTIREVRRIYPSEWDVPYPAGIVYVESAAHFLLIDQPGSGQAAVPGTTLVALTPYEDYIATVRLDLLLTDPLTIAADNHAQRLWLLDRGQGSAPPRLGEMQLDGEGLPDPATLVWHDLAALGSRPARGMAVDPTGHTLYILEEDTLEETSTLLQIRLDGTTEFESAETARIDLSQLGADDLHGLAVHPASGHLFVLSRGGQVVYELSPTGRPLATYPIAHLGLVSPQGLAFAPSPDLTDAPDTIHLFVADSRLKGQDQTSLSALPRQSGKLLCGRAPSAWQPQTATSMDRPAHTPARSLLYGEIVEIALSHPRNGSFQR